MELGSLPEWFTAFAEVTAVCVALFLPQYSAYRDRKASLARMRRVVGGMLDALATDRAHCEAGCDPRQLQSAQDLELYLRVSFFVLSDAQEIALRGDAERLYRQLVGPDPDLAVVRREIADLRQPQQAGRQSVLQQGRA